jgi:hypothetical protein
VDNLKCDLLKDYVTGMVTLLISIISSEYLHDANPWPATFPYLSGDSAVSADTVDMFLYDFSETPSTYRETLNLQNVQRRLLN